MEKAFTLVELIVTVAIIIILSMIGAPIYKNYQYEAKMSEGYMLLGLIKDAQFRYYEEYGTFLSDNDSSSQATKFTNEERVLGIDARENKYWSTFAVGYGASNIAFLARATSPVNGRNVLCFYYNLTTGSTFYESYS